MPHLRHAVTGLLALFLSAVPAVAAESVTFGRRLAAGDKVAFDQTMTMQSNTAVSANGQPLQQMGQSMKQVRIGTMTVEAVDAAGRPTKATFAFDPACGAEVTNPGAPGPQTVPSGLAGKTVTVTRTGDKALNYSAEVDPQSAAEIKEMFAPEGNIFPDKPLAPGESWDIDPAQLKNMVPPGQQMDAKAKGKLISVATAGGRQVATVEMTINLSGGAAQGVAFSSDLVGKGTVDVASGQPLDVTISGPLKASGQQPTPNGPVDVRVDGRTTMAMKSTLTPGAGGAVAAAEAVAGGGGGGGNPLAPKNPLAGGTAENPLAPKPRPRSPFDATFSDGKTTVKLTAAPDGTWSGTIKNGDNTYPITAATVDGTKARGKFTAGADAFDFDATLDADTLTLNTGGATYTLKRAAPANPLGR
jgi:hypothetical protein